MCLPEAFEPSLHVCIASFTPLLFTPPPSLHVCMTALHHAASIHAPTSVLTLLQTGSSPTSLNTKLQTPLHLALATPPASSSPTTLSDYHKTVSLLTASASMIATLTTVDVYKMTPLAYCTVSGNIALLAQLLPLPPILAQPMSYPNTAPPALDPLTLAKHLLLTAVRSSSLKTLTLLLTHLTPPLSDAPSVLAHATHIIPYLSSLLHTAAANGLLKISNKLIAHGADVNSTLRPPTDLWDLNAPPPTNASPDIRNPTPLHIAVANGDVHLTTVLLNNFADVFMECYGSNRTTVYKSFCFTKQSYTKRSFRDSIILDKISPFSLSIVTGNVGVLKAILQSTAVTSATAIVASNGKLAFNLMNAVILGPTMNPEMLLLFSKYLTKDTVTSLIHAQDESGTNSIMYAAMKADADMVARLIKLGGDVGVTRTEVSTRLQTLTGEKEEVEIAMRPLVEKRNESFNRITSFDPATEAANESLLDQIETHWAAARALLEEPDPLLRKKGGKTVGVKGIQKLATVNLPPSSAIAVLTYLFAIVLDLKNIGSTDPADYDPSTTTSPPSWWAPFQRAARNLKIGSKMLDCQENPPDASKLSKLLAQPLQVLPDPSSPHFTATNALRTFLIAYLTSCKCKSSPSYLPSYITYIHNKTALAALTSSLSSLTALINDSPTTAFLLSLAMRDPAPPHNSRGYGPDGPRTMSTHVTSVALSLIAHGAPTSSPDVTGETPITVACRKNYWSVALAIIDKGCDVSGACWGKSGMVRFNDSLHHDSTPLDFATKQSHVNNETAEDRNARLMVLRQLLLRGAQITPVAMANAIKSCDEIVVAILLTAENAVKFNTENLKYESSSTGSKTTVPRQHEQGSLTPTFPSKVSNNHTSSLLLPTSSSHTAKSFSFSRASLPSFPRHLDHASYSSCDSATLVCLNLLKTAKSIATSKPLYRPDRIAVTHAMHEFPGGPAAIYTVLDGVTAVLPSTLEHPLSSLLVNIETSNIFLADGTSSTFKSIFTGPLKSQHYKDFLRLAVAPHIPHTGAAVQMTHALAQSGDVELLNCLFSGSSYVNRAELDVTHDMMFRANADGKTALYIALESGNVDASQFLFHQLATHIKKHNLDPRKKEKGIKVSLSPPSAQFRKLFVDRARFELNQKSALVNEAAKFPYHTARDDVGKGDPVLAARAAVLLESLTAAGRCFAKLEAFNTHDKSIHECLSVADEETAWLIDQLSCVQAARQVLKSLELDLSQEWTDSFKTAMHFPSTIDVKKYVSLECVRSVKKFFMPDEWQRLDESGELLPGHVVAANCDLCKIKGSSVLLDGSRGEGDNASSMIPQDVLREARAKWALEDAVKENLEHRENVPDSPSKQRSQRFMRFIDAWRKSNNSGQAQRSIKAASLVLEWARMIIKVRVLLQAVYSSSGEVGKMEAVAGEMDPLSMLKKFDFAVGEEHEAALVYGEVEDMAKKIDEAEREAGGGARMRLRCMDTVSAEEWEGWKGSEAARKCVECIVGAGDGEDVLRRLQQVDLLEWGGDLEALGEAMKALRGDKGSVEECLSFLARSLVKCKDAPAIRFVRELEHYESIDGGNVLVPCIKMEGGMSLLKAMLSSGHFDCLEKDSVTGLSGVEFAALAGNDDVLHLLLAGLELTGEMCEGLLKGVLDASPVWEKLPRNQGSVKNFNIQESYRNVLNLLLDVGYDDFEGCCELAGKKGYMDVCRRLVEKGGLVELGEGGFNALHYACKAGDGVLSRAIVGTVGESELRRGDIAEEAVVGAEAGGGGEKGGGISAKMRQKLGGGRKGGKERGERVETPVWPLHLLCRGGFSCELDDLVQGECLEWDGRAGENTLGFECLDGGVDCLEVLLRKGWDAAKSKGAWWARGKRRVEGGVLEAAVEMGSKAAVKCLLEWEGGRLREEPCVSGEAAVKCLKGGRGVVCVELIKAVRGRDGEAAFDVNLEVDGEGLLHIACRTGQSKVVVFLLGLGVDVEKLDVSGLMGINCSIAGGHGDITKILGERQGVVRRAAGTIVQKLRFFCVVVKKLRHQGKGRGDVKKEQQMMLALGKSHGALR